MISSDGIHGQAERGFTLIELLVIIAIIGVLTSIAWVRMATLVPIYRLEGAARSLAAEIQRARGRAIASAKCFQVGFDVTAKTYQVKWSPDSTCTTFPNSDSAKSVDDAGSIEIDDGSGGTPATPVFQWGGTVSPASIIRLSNSAGAARTIFVRSSGRVVVQ